MGKKKNDSSLSLMDECITDAKALMEISLFNAQEKLKERFTPQLKSLIAKRLQQEEDEIEDDELDSEIEDEDMDDFDETEEEDAVSKLEDAEPDIDVEDDEDIDIDVEDDVEDDEDIDIDVEDDEEDIDIDEGEYIDDEEDEEDEEINIEAIMKQMAAITEDEDEGIDIDDEDEDIDIDIDEDIDIDDDEEDIDIDVEDDEEDLDEDIFTSFNTLDEDEDIDGEDIDIDDDEDEDIDIDIDDEDNEQLEQLERTNRKLRNELKKYKAGTRVFKEKIAEQKFVQAKLLYVNDMLKRKHLSEVQKYKIVEAFDKARNISDIKLIYKTLFEAYKERQKRIKKTKAKNLQEGVSSRTMLVDKKQRIIENRNSNPMKDRFQVLANIKKK